MATLRALLLATFLGQESRSSMGRGLERSHSASHGPSRAFFKTQTGFVLRISELFWAALLCHWFLSRSFSPCCASLWFCFGKQKPQCDDWQVASLPELGPGGSWSTCWDAKSDEFLFAVFTWSSYCGLPRLVEDSFGAYSILYNRELSFTMVEIPIDQPISYGIIPINQAVFHGMMAFGRSSHCSPVFSSRHQWLQLGATAGCCTCPVSIQAGGCPAK